MNARRSFAAVLPLVALTLVACKKKDEGAAADSGAADAAVAVVDSGPAMPTPSNESSVARYGDETKLADVDAKVEKAKAVARDSASGGPVVATLAHGTAVTEIAQHGKFILVKFLDPKDSAKALEGWVGEESFKASTVPPVPPKGSCPGKQVHLISEDTIFCGDVCKEDKDCPNNEKCTGHSNSYADGKEGAEVTTCTVVAGAADAGTAPSTPAGPTIKDVQMPPVGGKCTTAGYVMALDNMCHKTCPKGPTDCTNAQSKCTAKITADKTGVCQSTAK